MILSLFALLVITTSFGMGGLRVEIEHARAQGKSEDYVAGLAARSKQLQAARFEVAIYGLGLVVIGVAGWLRRK